MGDGRRDIVNLADADVDRRWEEIIAGLGAPAARADDVWQRFGADLDQAMGPSGQTQ